ncbi:MAG: Na/Pi symporter, partial [Clostridia bacterium]|nr:Na/Pi symporter [Clostridia bacterium]
MLKEAENAKYYRFAIKRFQTTQTFAVTIKHKIMSALDIISNLLLLFAGIGVFLIATKLMSSNLELVGGNKLKSLFAKTSKNKFLGAGIGTLGTAIIQSSGATSVMAIGFVNAGIMTVSQAAPILLGANIGTTITGQIVAIGFLTGSGTSFSATILFSALAGVGALMTYFSKKDMVKKVGGILGGLGLLFVGLNTMSTAMKPFANGVVQEFIASISFRGFEIVLMLVGVLLTAVIQSSSVTSSIAITMLISGLINLDQGIYLVLGSNIGAVVVALLACIGSKTNAKRAAMFHLITNVIRVVVFLVIVEVIIAATGNQFFMGDLFKLMFPKLPQFQLSMFHTLFNIVSVLIILPFTNLFVKLCEKIIPEEEKEAVADTQRPSYI